jgi:hypothetical protein
MGSQTDLDQGGTFRTKTKIYLGPSVGWVDGPSAILRITAAGTTIAQLGNSLILVSVNGAVTIQLPTFKATSIAATLSGQYVEYPIAICDVGGFALANPITILPGGSELISGLASITIASNFGAVVLQPDPVNGGCTVTQ